MTEEMKEEIAETSEEAVPAQTGAGEVQSTFRERLRAFHADVLKCNWDYDKFLTYGGKQGYPYLSADKCKRNLAPLVVKHGFDLELNFSELTLQPAYGNVSNHWSIKLEASLVDCVTGERTTSTVYGECGDAGDKGIAKAQTYALKTWIVNTCLLADGMDPDMDTTPVGGTFQKRSPEETEEIRSKVLGKGIAPSAPAEPRKPAEPKKPEQEPKKPEQEPKAEAEDAGKEAPKGGPTVPENLSPIHKAAVEKILERYQAGVDSGSVGGAEYDVVVAECAALKDAKDAVAFIKKYKE